MPFPDPGMDLDAKAAHFFQHPVYIGHDILSIDINRRIAAITQGHVKDSTILGEVDVLAAEHAVRPAGDIRLACQLQQ